jgi:predicted peptidase
MAYLLDTIDQVALRWHVDRQRILLMGCSMGGNGTWGFGSHCAELFAALAPMSGFWADFQGFPMQNLVDKPIYVLHGTKDEVVPIDGARQAVAKLKELGGSALVREPDCGHQLPTEEISAVATWLLQQPRNPQTWDLAALRARVQVLAVPGWLKKYPGN